MRQARQPARSAGWVRLLEEDPDLGAALDEPAEARKRCVARVVEFDRGAPWAADEPEGGADRLGYLVLEGAFVNRLSVAGGETVDLLGPGDLLRPWPTQDGYSELLSSCRWQVVERARLALLDRGFLEQAGRWPEVGAALVDRAVRHSRSLAMRLSIAKIRQLRSRIQVMLWHLADRFGRVDREGVLVPLRLSHEVIAELVSAQRPSVSRSLKELSDHGAVVRVAEGWRLCARPPPALAAVLPTPVAGPGGLDRTLSDAVTAVVNAGV